MIDYIIIGLIVIMIILLIINLTKKNKDPEISEKMTKMEANISKEITEFKYDFTKTIGKDFNDLNDRLERKLTMINDKVNERLDLNFEKTNKAFTGVLERLAKIDEAQKKIDSLSTDIVSLQSVLTDKKTRGIFGEVTLNHILTSVFGENNKNVYALQYSLPNNTIADAIVFAPNPLGTIAIDSKFPLENYKIMVDKNNLQIERDKSEKLFKADVKRHIDAISKKYIIDGVTSEGAIMFLPAEAIFAEINAYHEDLLMYANKNKVWITSPTTLISMLSIVQTVLTNMERDKYTSIIHTELNKLGSEFDKYKTRWDKLSRSIETVGKDVKDIHITTDKITKRFSSISSVDIEGKIEEKV